MASNGLKICCFEARLGTPPATGFSDRFRKHTGSFQKSSSWARPRTPPEPFQKLLGAEGPQMLTNGFQMQCFELRLGSPPPRLDFQTPSGSTPTFRKESADANQQHRHVLGTRVGGK